VNVSLELDDDLAHALRELTGVEGRGSRKRLSSPPRALLRLWPNVLLHRRPLG